MTADIRMIDYLANLKNSPYHRASALSKGMATLLILGGVIFNESLAALGVILALLALAIYLSKLPLIKILKWSIYPVFFASLFAFSVFLGAVKTMPPLEALYLPMVFLARSLSAALALLLLLSTTPYPQVFGLLRRALPELVVNTMLMTYRFFFLLIDELENLLRAMRLRGSGLSPAKIIRNMKDYGKIVGVLLIHSIDMSERMYGIFLVRGYAGKFSVEGSRWQKEDVFPLSLGLGIFATSILWRSI